MAANSGSWIFDEATQSLIPKNEYLRSKYASGAHAHSDLPRPMIVSDNLDYMFSHVDGRRYTSKRAYEKSVRAAGLTIVGNDDPAKHVSPAYDEAQHDADIRADVMRAFSEAKLTA